MFRETIKTHGRTTGEGALILTVNVGVPDADVAVIVHVKALTSAEETDANGWPIGFLSELPGRCPICVVIELA